MKRYLLVDNGDDSIYVDHVHKRLIPLIKEIDYLFKKNNIDYIINGGTLLGAIRHQGFIPWDDDFDIAIKFDDLDAVIDVLNKQLSDKYCFQSYYSDLNYNVLLPAFKVRIKDTYVIEKNVLLKHNCNNGDGIFIDIFLLSNISENKFEDFRYRFFNIGLMPIICLLDNMNIRPKKLKKLFIDTAYKYHHKNRDSKYIGVDLTWTFSFLNPDIFLKEDIFKTIDIKFENLSLPVPKNYHNFLVQSFGENYMELPHVSKQEPKHIKYVEL